MATSAEIETRWVDAWNEVHDIAGDRLDVPCLLPDFRVVALPELLGWLQESAYSGCSVRVEAGWAGHRPGILAYSTPADAEPGAAADSRGRDGSQ